MTANGEGFGVEIGLGSKRLCEKYGCPELSMAVKGQEFPAYDPRGIQGMGLTYATSNRSAWHLRSYTVASETLGIPVKTDPLVTEGKPGLVMAFQDATAAFDSAGLCVFTSFAWGLGDIQPQIDAACEGDWSEAKLQEVGERIWNMEKLFNLEAGLTKEDDQLPKRLTTEPATEGPAKVWLQVSLRCFRSIMRFVAGTKMVSRRATSLRASGCKADARTDRNPSAM